MTSFFGNFLKNASTVMEAIANATREAGQRIEEAARTSANTTMTLVKSLHIAIGRRKRN